MKEHPFDKIDLLSFVTGSASDITAAAIRSHLASCDSCRAYCSSLEAGKRSFLAANPFEQTITLPARSEPKRITAFFGAPLYALAATLVVCIGAGWLYLAQHGAPQMRIKGEAGLKVFVQNADGAVEKRQSMEFRTGEKIQFLYSCGAANRCILLSIDTTGTITTYFPADGDSSCALEPGQDLPLPNSIVLDEYTGRELFLGFFSGRPLSAGAVRRRVADAFSVSRSIDSLDLGGMAAAIITCPFTVRKGGE
jgi:hypothetical protein